MNQHFAQTSGGFVWKLITVFFSLVLLVSLLPATALAASGEPEAFAVYDEGTKTLSFHKQEVVPAVGETFTGSDGVERTATAVYTGVETTAYAYSTDVHPLWSDLNDVSNDAEHIEIVDMLAPISTASWFSGKENVASIDLRKLDTSHSTNMAQMFQNCSSLVTIDVSGFDTSNVTDMRMMFNGCSSLTSIDVAHFDTGNVTDMRLLFARCSSLTHVDLRSFDTSKVTAINTMFNGCTSIVEIDLSSFDTSSVNMTPVAMFKDCASLTTIYVGDKWNLERYSTKSSPVFSGCVNLVGGSGTKFSKSNQNKMSYLHIDGGERFPGYLSTHKKPIGSTEISGIDVEYVLSTDTVGPIPVIQDGDKVLEEGVDYTVEYVMPSKTKPTLTITGIGEYGGYIIKTYKTRYVA